MAGLLDYLSNLKFEPDAKSMGLMNMGANMLNASSMSPTPVGFGNVMGAGLGGFNQGYMAQKKDEEAQALAEQKKLLDAATINKDNAMAGYYNTGGAGQNADNLRQSTDGWFRVNKDTKNPEFLVGPDGRRLMPQGSDLELIRAKYGIAPVKTVDANGNVDVTPTSSLDPFYANNPKQPIQNNLSQPQDNLTEEQIIGAYQNSQITKEQAISALQSIAPPGMMPNEISLGVSRQPDLIQQASPSQVRQTPAQREASLANARVPADVAQAQAHADIENQKTIALAELKKQQGNDAIDLTLKGVMPKLYPPDGKGGLAIRRDENGRLIPPDEQMFYGGTPTDRFNQKIHEYSNTSDPKAQNLNSIRRAGSDLVLQANNGTLGVGVSNADVDFLGKMQGILDTAQNINDVYSAFADIEQRVNRIRGKSINVQGSNQLNTQPQAQPSIDDLVNHYGGGK